MGHLFFQERILVSFFKKTASFWNLDWSLTSESPDSVHQMLKLYACYAHLSLIFEERIFEFHLLTAHHSSTYISINIY